VSSLDVTLLNEATPKRLSAGGWLLFNLRVGGLTFGMGAMTPIFERALVQETRSLTAQEFQETLTLAQVLPGPSLVSLVMYLGQRQFGTLFGLFGVVCLCLPGALWATAENALITLAVTALAGLLYARRILGPMALIAASGLSFALLSFALQHV